MLGTIVNVSTIIIGSIIGATLKKNFNKNYQEALFIAMGMCALIIGLQASMSSINAGGSLVLLIINMSIGTLIIVGPMESALHQNNSLLYTNASLDFITSIAMSAAYGICIIFAAIFLFLFQGGIYLLTLTLEDKIPTYILNNLTMTGGVLIIMSGLCLLNIKNIKTTDYLPALLISPLTSYIGEFFK